MARLREDKTAVGLASGGPSVPGGPDGPDRWTRGCKLERNAVGVAVWGVARACGCGIEWRALLAPWPRECWRGLTRFECNAL